MEAKVEFDDGKLPACSSIPRFTKQEGERLEKLLREEETFRAALHTLTIWLERGECKEENCPQFRILIQLCWDRFEKLAAQKESNCKLMKKEDDIQIEVNEMEKVFNVIEMRGIWANFTPNQITELKKMRTDISGLKQNICTDVNAKQKLTEMEKDEKMTLICKIDCLINQLNTAKEQIKDLEKELSEVKSKLEESRKWDLTTDVALLYFQKEAELIALLSCFLVEHPGVNVEFIYLNLKGKYPIDRQEIEKFMRKYPRIFEESFPNETTKVWNCVSAPPEILEELKNKK